MVNFKRLRQMIETKGNGNITTREISVSSFLRLHLSINGNVELIQSDEEKVVIETDENLQSYFEVVNSGKTLYVTGGNKFWIPVFTQLSIKVYCRQMNMLYNALQGNVFSSNQLICNDSFELKIHAQGDTKLNIKASTIKVNAACQGNIELKGECHELTIKNASQGDIDCKEMIADITSLSNASQGSVKLYSKEEVRIKHAGQGDVHYYGEGKLKNILHHGDGEVKHKK